MEIMQIIWEYTMPTLVAFTIVYFFYAMGKFKDATSYSDDEEAVSLLFSALTLMFIVVNVWLVIMLSTALL